MKVFKKNLLQEVPFSDGVFTITGGEKAIALNKSNFKTTEEAENVPLGTTMYKADVIVLEKNDDVSTVTKEYNLKNIVSYNNFYADAESRLDLITPLIILLAESLDREALLPIPGWKKTDGLVSDVKVGEFLDAIQESLVEKGKIVGVS